MRKRHKMKLDVCGGAYPMGGDYLNIDIKPIPGVDVVADITQGLPFRTGAVDEIVSCGTLEHFSQTQLQRILKEFFRVMRDGAKLRIGVPDLRALINAYTLGKIDIKLMNQYLYGRAKDEYDVHKTVLDYESLFGLLSEAGFHSIRKVPYSFPFHIPDLMMEVECLKEVKRVEAYGSGGRKEEVEGPVNELRFTGERLIPTDSQLHDLYIKHVSRYLFASQYTKDATVLDAGCGCGYGTYTMALAGAGHVVGIDNSVPAISFSRRHYSLRNTMFATADCLNMPFRDESFERVVSFEVLEHVEDYSRYLEECHRVLKCQGLLVISTPNKGIFEGKENPYHVKEFHLDEFEASLKQYFEVIDILGQSIGPSYVVQAKNQQTIHTFLATMINYYEQMLGYTERQLDVLRSTTEEKTQELNRNIIKILNEYMEVNFSHLLNMIRMEREFTFKEMPWFLIRSILPVRLKFFFPTFVRRWVKNRIQKKIEYFWGRLDQEVRLELKEISARVPHLKTRIYFPINKERKKLSRPPLGTIPLSLSDMVIRREGRETAPYLIALCRK